MSRAEAKGVRRPALRLACDNEVPGGVPGRSNGAVFENGYPRDGLVGSNPTPAAGLRVNGAVCGPLSPPAVSTAQNRSRPLPRDNDRRAILAHCSSGRGSHRFTERELARRQKREPILERQGSRPARTCERPRPASGRINARASSRPEVPLSIAWTGSARDSRSGLRERTGARPCHRPSRDVRESTSRTVDGHQFRPPWAVAVPSSLSRRAICPRMLLAAAKTARRSATPTTSSASATWRSARLMTSRRGLLCQYSRKPATSSYSRTCSTTSGSRLTCGPLGRSL